MAVADRAGVSRERARALIMAGNVFVRGEPALKAGALLGADSSIEIRGARERFVSRAGAKLERALDAFGWSVRDLHCLDVGASTGGFTDCLLQRGAASVTALDVGYGQLAWALRNDSRVRVIERCNFRLADPAAIGAPFDFISADVSFISLATLARQFRAVAKRDARIVVLVKPQFEAGRRAVGKGGVVRDRAAHVAAIDAAVGAFRAAGLEPVHLTYSPLRGPAGNIEFLLGAMASNAAQSRTAGEKLAGNAVGVDNGDIDAAGVVAAAHEALAR